MDKEKKIFVFADFQPYHEEIIGTIYVSQTRGKEFYSFEYDQKWLEKGNMILDPDLQMYKGRQTSVYKGYKQDKIEMRGDRAEMSDFPLYLNTVAGGLDRRDQTIGGFSFVVKIYTVPVVEIIG